MSQNHNTKYDTLKISVMMGIFVLFSGSDSGVFIYILRKIMQNMVGDQHRKLDNQVAIVTGGGSGIGRAIAVIFAEHGARVVVADVMGDNAEDTVTLIKERGGSAIAVQADVSQKPAVEKVMAEANRYARHVDILVNNVAMPVGTNILSFDEDVWDATVQVTLKSVYLCSRAVLPGMIEQKSGSIVNIASVNALSAFGTMSYSAAKAGVVNLTKNLAVTYGPHNIRVNVVCPGVVKTSLWDKRLKRNPAFFEQIAKWYPLGRAGESEDVAKAVLFLASSDASWITGATLVVDGGLTAGNSFMMQELENPKVYSAPPSILRRIPRIPRKIVRILKSLIAPSR
jgi:NAD(P)-dependent dehydrogenase (short-subunit alcohol dehydrogenase family)